jgi:hypothetical protein
MHRRVSTGLPWALCRVKQTGLSLCATDQRHVHRLRELRTRLSRRRDHRLQTKKGNVQTSQGGLNRTPPFSFLKGEGPKKRIEWKTTSAS